jgi:hypothetical protein
MNITHSHSVSAALGIQHAMRMQRNDLKKMGVKNWKQSVQERNQWKEIIEQVKTHKEL